MEIEFTLNGNKVSVDVVDRGTTLLDVLRNDFELNGPKFGCGLGQCGACAVLLEGFSTRTCITSVLNVAGKSVTTLEGLGAANNPHPLQTAFIEEQALQCGYCASGIIISAAALLNKKLEPTEQLVKETLNGHLCRCGAQPRMIKAVMRAAEIRKGEKE